MAKRTKKAPIKPEKRKEWLRRHEEDGESPPQIATRDGFDVRTVRKQIAIAQEEREAREARAQVLRNAMEGHYDDLRRYAEYLDAQLSDGDHATAPADLEFLEAALRQHLPRSPIWNYRTRLQELSRRISEVLLATKSTFSQAIKTDARLRPLLGDRLDWIDRGLVAVLVANAHSWAQGGLGSNLVDSVNVQPGESGRSALLASAHIVGEWGHAEAEQYRKMLLHVIGELESRLRASQAYDDLEKITADTGRVRRKLKDELAVIRLRRIVPGHCKFCPL